MRKLCLLALPLLFALAACKPQPAATPAHATHEPQPIAEPAAAATPGPASLAGKFGDGESVLELRADGSYVQTLHVAGSEISGDGHWSVENGGTLLRLDPNSKEAEDARFAVVSANLLKGTDGREFKRIVE